MTIAVLGAASLSAWASPTFNAGAATLTPSSTSAANANPAKQDDAVQTSSRDETAVAPKAADGSAMDPEQIEQLQQLKQTDRAVRQHEMAHQTVGGAYAGGASYDYEMGPDGLCRGR